MVIDTMLFVYVALNVRPFRDESYAVLSRASGVAVPESMPAELLNAAWQHTRASGVGLPTAIAAIDDALGYVSRRVPIDVLWHDALRLAVDAGHSPYDTLFVALAEREGAPLVTYDAKLPKAFPAVAVTPTDVLARP